MGTLLPELTAQGLCCPYDHGTLQRESRGLICAAGHRFPVVAGVPVLLRQDVEPSQAKARSAWQRALCLGAQELTTSVATATPVIQGVHPVVQQSIVGTGGNYYRSLQGQLTRYPIPYFPRCGTNSERLLDIGCGWGRWSFAAAQAGFCVTGVDHDLDRVLAAQQIAQQLGLRISFIVADLRYLPLRPQSFERIFSYSVLQHFDEPSFDSAIGEVARVLRPGGLSLIQLPNRWGAASLYHQLARGCRPARDYEVRYRAFRTTQRRLTEIIGPTSCSVDGFIGLNAQIADLDLMPWTHRLVIQMSQRLTQLSRWLVPLQYVADSLYFESCSPTKPQSND